MNTTKCFYSVLWVELFALFDKLDWGEAVWWSTKYVYGAISHLFLLSVSSAFLPHSESRINSMTCCNNSWAMLLITVFLSLLLCLLNTGVWIHMSCRVRRSDPKVTRWKANVQRCGRAFKDEVASVCILADKMKNRSHYSALMIQDTGVFVIITAPLNNTKLN